MNLGDWIAKAEIRILHDESRLFYFFIGCQFFDFLEFGYTNKKCIF